MRITVTTLQKMVGEGHKIAMLTCYEASFASLLEEAGVEVLLVGDSLGMVVQGRDSTLPVSLDEMVYHTACVARGSKTALIVADLSFGSYQQSREQAFAASVALMQAGAHMVKLEGGAFMADTVRFLVERGIPVCGHIGLTPQSVNTLGGYKVQGKTDAAAEQLMVDAKALSDAGAALIVLECVPAELARRVTDEIAAGTIGIGAGVDCDGQVLVLHDMLGIYPGKKARFVKNFMVEAGSIQGAVGDYVREVKAKTFPAAEHIF